MMLSVLFSLIILHTLNENKRAEISLLFFTTMFYCLVTQFGFLTETSYEIATLISCTLLFSCFQYKELFWVIFSSLPFKILEYMFYISPLTFPTYLYEYVLDFDSWYLYGIVGLFLKLDTLVNYHTTKQTIIHGTVAFILVVPFINNYI